MSFDVSVILPNDLRSGYLQSEFIASGLAYTTSFSSLDSTFDKNRNSLVFSFELRSKTTRELLTMLRVKTLYLSNDPEFEPTSTVQIQNIPNSPSEYDASTNYIVNLNPEYFFDNTASVELSRSTEVGTGLFIINNWALSANGGLSRVYMKAVITGPGGLDAEYPQGYGLFDTILWQGSYPVNPQNSKFSTMKDGWIGKNSVCIFNSGSSSGAQTNSTGVSNYLLSLHELASIGNTPELYSVRSEVKRTLVPNKDSFSTSFISRHFSRDNSNTYIFTPVTFVAGTPIDLSTTSNRGAYLETAKNINLTSSKNSLMSQADFTYQASSIGLTSQLFMSLNFNQSLGVGSSSYTVRVDFNEYSNPTSSFYHVAGYSDSASQQSTSLPASMLPLLKNGGLMELYYQNVDSSYGLMEVYFTPREDQNQISSKSFLLANSMIPALGTTALSTSIAYQINDGIGATATFRVDELCIATGNSKLSSDIGSCDNTDYSLINEPIVTITNTWNTDINEEYKLLTDGPIEQTYNYSLSSSSLSLPKINSSATYTLPGLFEVQLFRPSLSNKTSISFDVLHNSDDFYVAFSPLSSYRPYTKNGVQIDWERPLGSRCDEKYSYTDIPINASTISVVFSKDKKNITILQRTSDNILHKHVVKSYTPSATTDSYVIEISDQALHGLNNSSVSKYANSTWVYIKKSDGVKLDLIGYAQLNLKTSSSSKGLGYFCGLGFKESSYSNGSNVLSNLELRTLPNISSLIQSEESSFRSFNLSDEGLSNSQHYLGQNCVARSTDFVGFNYENPFITTTPVNVKVATVGSNVNVSNISSLTIDGVSISSLVNDDFILIKDQTLDSENGVYKKVSGSWVKQTVSLNDPFKITLGTVNAGTFWYYSNIQLNNTTVKKFISTAFFTDLNISQVSNFVSSARALLFEFKMIWRKYNSKFPLSDVKIRFFADSSSTPDSENPLTDWLSISYNPLSDDYLIAPNNSLVQVVMADSASAAPSVSSNTKIWVAISLPFNTSLAEANNKDYENQEIITNGKFSYYKLARNLWHKLHIRYAEKSENLTQSNNQHFRIKTVSHANYSSHATNLSTGAQIDILPPGHNDGKPEISSINGYDLRVAKILISAEDNDSGIVSFRVGKEIDNSRVSYTSWLSWSDYVTNNDGTYYIYLYGDLNYYDSGVTNSTFDSQNIGFSGSRKVWVQLMDYAGNVSESHPLTFVATTYSIVDTQAPYGKASFYNPKTNQSVGLVNTLESYVKIDATDLVSGIKDFKVRRIYDSGPGNWSEWEYFSQYRVIDFTGEKDGVKKVEFAFRDFGNNVTQPEVIWEKVTRANK